ncbi:hypothetical protein DCE93_04900 [Agromyces badenianii]|uniref:FHA domain-containing protein n=1 Tax=Agromyces badenianii TaxID=2080742 RepID=A0A2S0WUV2_9MICO|nr:hypothetical protein DCE93_04900 [Agromyces badenianii]
MIGMVAGRVSSSAVAGAPAWDVIVGDRFLAALAAPAPERVLTALAEAASDGGLSLEALVGLIPSGRVDPIESFGIVWWAAGATTSVTAVVRGDAVVDLASPGGSRRFDARGIRPWHLADFRDVVALRITDAASALDHVGLAGEPVVPVRASLRASAVEWAASRSADAEPDPPFDLDADTVLAPRLHESGLHGAVADTIITPRRARVSRTAVPPSAQRTDPPPSAVPRSAPQPSDAPPSGTQGEGAPPAGAAEATEVPAASTATSIPRFRVGDGAPVPVTAPVLIGRRPLPPRIAETGPRPELLTVGSPRGVVSGTHLELRLVGTRLVATDLRSTNGTVVRTPSGTRRLRAGESIVVLPGTILDLGDDTIIEILSAQSSPGA